MELFTASDQSQMQIIKQWIDESDVYILILGGRYGSIEKETQKSYTHLEYEYAIEKGKPYFSIIIDEKYLNKKVRSSGKSTSIGSLIELENPEKLRTFRKIVESKIVKYWDSTDKIKIAIMEKLPEYERHTELIGWIRGNESALSSEMIEELTRLSKENNSLRETVDALQRQNPDDNYLDEIYHLFLHRKLEVSSMPDSTSHIFSRIAHSSGQEYSNYIHMFWYTTVKLREGISYRNVPNGYVSFEMSDLDFQDLMTFVYYFEEFRLIDRTIKDTHTDKNSVIERSIFHLSELGKRFLIKLTLNGTIKQIEDSLEGN